MRKMHAVVRVCTHFDERTTCCMYTDNMCTKSVKK